MAFLPLLFLWGAPWRGRTGAGLALVGLLVLLAFAGPYLTAWGWTDIDARAFGAPPSGAHWLGTTPSGRDMYALSLRALRRSLVLGPLVAVSATAGAALVGTVAGRARGLTGSADLLLVCPPVLVAAVVSPAFRTGSVPAVALLLSALMWPVTSRVGRAVTAARRGPGYVRHLVARAPSALARHVAPRLVPLLAADAILTAGAAVIDGTRDVSLGTLIADGAPSVLTLPWLLAPPLALLALLLLGTHLAAGARGPA